MCIYNTASIIVTAVVTSDVCTVGTGPRDLEVQAICRQAEAVEVEASVSVSRVRKYIECSMHKI